MTKQIIVTDSTSDLSHEYLKQHNIHVVPLSLTIDGKSFVDQIDITSEAFIQRIEEDADVKTSQPPIGNLLNYTKNLVKRMLKSLVSICHQAKWYIQTALQASDMVDTKVTVIDSKSISFDSATKSNDLLN